MAYPSLHIPQRNWFVVNLKTLPTATPTGTITTRRNGSSWEGHGMKESSRETGCPLRRGKRILCSSERPYRFWGPPSLLYGWFYSRGWSCRVGNLTDHSRPSSANVKNDWNCSVIYPFALTAWCLTKHKDNCFSCCPEIGLGRPRNTTRMSFRIVSAMPRFKLGTSWVQVTALQSVPILATWHQLQLFLNVI